MPDFYLPSEKMNAFLSSLGQGFCIEANEKGDVVLMIKMEPSLVVEVVKGCRVDIVVRNPNKRCRGCAIFIYDKPGDPFFFEGAKFGEEDPVLLGFDHVLIDLINRKNKITLALYNELNHPIFCTDLPISVDALAFEHWVNKIQNEEYDKIFVGQSWRETCDPENKSQGFNIQLLNRDHSAESQLIIIT
jgi:hypothetical protein